MIVVGYNDYRRRRQKEIASFRVLGSFLLGSINNYEGFGWPSYTTIAMGNYRIEVKAVTFLKGHAVIPVAKFQASPKDEEELFPAVVVEDDITGLTLLHFDNKGLH